MFACVIFTEEYLRVPCVLISLIILHLDYTSVTISPGKIPQTAADAHVKEPSSLASTGGGAHFWARNQSREAYTENMIVYCVEMILYGAFHMHH